VTDRAQAMVAARRLNSRLKRQRVAAAVDALAATGQEISIAAIARHAGVSRKFIYTHPDLRAQIEQRAQQAAVRAGARAAADGQVTVASRPDELRRQLDGLQAQIFELKEQLADAHARNSMPSARSTANCSPTATDRPIDPTRSGRPARRDCRVFLGGGEQQSSIRRAIRSIVSANSEIASSAPSSPHPDTYGIVSLSTANPTVDAASSVTVSTITSGPAPANTNR